MTFDYTPKIQAQALWMVLCTTERAMPSVFTEAPCSPLRPMTRYSLKYRADPAVTCMITMCLAYFSVVFPTYLAPLVYPNPTPFSTSLTLVLLLILPLLWPVR